MVEAETSQAEKVGSVAENVKRVTERMQQAAERVGREPAEVRLVAASKMVEAARPAGGDRCRGDDLGGELPARGAQKDWSIGNTRSGVALYWGITA